MSVMEKVISHQKMNKRTNQTDQLYTQQSHSTVLIESNCRDGMDISNIIFVVIIVCHQPAWCGLQVNVRRRAQK